MRFLAKNDLYFLLRYVLSTRRYFKDPNKYGVRSPQWILDRCREIQGNCDGYLDVWSRFHLKSTIKTFGELIRSILNNPEICIGIFSHVRGISKGFLRQIKLEFEGNELLKFLFPEILYAEPHKESPCWGLNDGIVVKRVGNPPASTVEAWGLVDSHPTAKHFDIRNYDDVVTEDSISTPEMIDKTTKAWELSLALGKPGGQAWYTGTFYAHDDTYGTMIKRGIKLRIHPCYEVNRDESEIDPETGYPKKLIHHADKPVLYFPEHLNQLFKEMGSEQGSRTSALQMLCDPNAGMITGFKREWLRYYEPDPWDIRPGKNIYILVDPANEKKKDSDYTAMWVVGLGRDHNFYVLDIVRDRLDLRERADKLFKLHTKWSLSSPHATEVRYEKYGLQTDIPYIEDIMERRDYRFKIVEVGSNVRKDDRIERLVPLFREGRVFLPKSLWYTNYEDQRRNLVEDFIEEEYLSWPSSRYKDMLDSLARISEPELRLHWPEIGYLPEHRRLDKWEVAWKRKPKREEGLSWMAS